MNYMLRIYNKIRSIGFYQDQRMLYCLAASVIAVMFIAGMVVGANFFRQDSITQSVNLAVLDQTGQLSQVPASAPVQSSQSQSLIQASDQSQPSANVVSSAALAGNQKTLDATKSLTATVRRKDNLTRIFKRNGLIIKDAKAILALKQASALRDLHVGSKLNLTIEKDETSAKLKKLVYVIDKLNTLSVVLHQNGWRAQIKHVNPTVKLSYAAATIRGSVYTAANQKGIPHKIVAQLEDIFSKKANFRKMHVGDRIAVVYKEFSVDGEKMGDGEVVAAELVHNNKKHRMIGFTDIKGITNYYTPEGYNSKPPFLRLPLRRYDHIGSRFSFNRMHPILGYRRAHLGVDLAAAHGTPIIATSSGKVSFIGYKGGHGRTIEIKRGSYKTLYAHLSRYASGVSSGGHVKQGQTIGYVGSTGLSTGPHLHYEVCINGVHHDPMRVKLPVGEMIAPEYRKKFFTISKSLVAQLERYSKDEDKMFAMNSFNRKS